ncbi:HAD-IA family hydrolase [Salipiger mucosus]|uniref:Phosphoglycolate phosphatase-like protein n=1 Tax=Salipiger mucosus DSM 16094 TaxID=1123237 RepID=S9QZT1_9RHOB|nr:HAD-IA family hydrolase [Salipiger mucosus]EPX86906.1 phosphoglycolate phosphatase-like protein [Salipiger mucosus DSM 16094]
MTDLRLVIFDVDGTLVDSQADILASMSAAFEAVALPVPGRETVLSIVGLSLPEAMSRLAPGADKATRGAMVEGYKARYMTLRSENGTAVSSPLYPHVRGVLDALHAQPETLLGIATGKSRRGLDKLVDGHGIRPLFVTQQCADDHPSKPNPAMLKAALAETGVAPRRAVMIGDTSYDMEMARAAGMLAIGVSWGYHDAARLADAHMILDDIRLLPGLLQQVWEQTA